MGTTGVVRELGLVNRFEWRDVGWGSESRVEDWNEGGCTIVEIRSFVVSVASARITHFLYKYSESVSVITVTTNMYQKSPITHLVDLRRDFIWCTSL
jgi:hypothetical protein